MELKETSHISKSKEMNVVTKSERNNSENRGIYNILFHPEERIDDPYIDSKDSNKNHEAAIFGNVSTLDWLKTWRSLENS